MLTLNSEPFEWRVLSYEARKCKSKVKVFFACRDKSCVLLTPGQDTITFQTCLQLLVLKKMGLSYLKLGDRISREHRMELLRRAVASELICGWVVMCKLRKEFLKQQKARRMDVLKQQTFGASQFLLCENLFCRCVGTC